MTNKPKTPLDLITEHNEIKNHLATQIKAFGDYCKPYQDRQKEIDSLLLAYLNEQQLESVKTDAGTCYKSTLLNVKLTDSEAYLDFVLEDWDSRGGMLKIGTPQADELRAYMDKRKKEIEDYAAAHDGNLPPDATLTPPGVVTEPFTRLNIRKS